MIPSPSHLIAEAEKAQVLGQVIPANQAISSEIELERLLSVLMKIFIENTGAQTGYLILPCQTTSASEEEWAIAASGTTDIATPVVQASVLQSLPIADYLPASVINYVIDSLESVVLDDATREGNFINDAYIQQHQTKSILSAPLLHQEKLIAIVYLENNLTNGVFTKERLAVLKLLSAQAAISLNNAKLYTQLRESEQQLRARERQLTQILEAMPIGVTAHDTTGKFIYTNLKARELLGINAPLEVETEQLSQVFQVYQAGGDQLYPTDQMPILRALAGESVKVDDLELRQANKTVPLEVLTTPIFDETGAIIYAIAVFTDISKRKQAQNILANYHHNLETQVAERTKVLQQQNEILQTLFNHIPVMLKLRDQAGQAVLINREYERVLGWSFAELQETDWLAKCYPDLSQRQQVVEHIQATTGKWQDFKTRCRDGRYVDTSWVNIRLSDGRTIGIGQDISDRKRLEEALKASQAKLNDILNSAGASIASSRFYPNRTWESDYHSTGCEAVFGYTPEELTSAVWSSRVPSEDLAAINEQAFAAIAQGQAITVEYRFYHKNGSLRWIADTLTSRWDQAGGYWIVTIVGVDITDRKQAEIALRASEERFREIAENINQLFFVWSADSQQFLYISPGYEKIYGLTCESLYQNPRSWLEVVHPDDRESVLQSLNQQYQGKHAQREYRIIKKDGTIRWMFAEVFPIFDQAGNLLRYIGLTEDITKRKRAEEALRESEQFLRSIYEGITAGVFIFDVLEDGSFRYVGINPAYERMSGLLSQEVADKTPEQVLSPEDARAVITRYRACIIAKKRITYEEHLVIKGKETWWITNLSPLQNEDGRIYRLIGSCFNITKRKGLEQSLQLQAEQERLLSTITQHIRQSLELEEILRTTVVEVQQTLQADRVLILRLNQDGSGQVIEEAVVSEYPMTEQMCWVDECLPDDCYEYYRQGHPRILPDVAKDEWAGCLVEFMQQMGVKSKVVAPIVQTLEDSSTRVWGLLIVHACSQYHQWQASEAEFLQQISDQLAIAIHQANLYHQLQTELAERKQIQLALQERQAILRAIGDNLPRGFIFQIVHVPDQGVYFSYISAGIEDLIGLNSEAIVQDANVLRSLIFEEDKVVRKQLAQKSLETLCIFEMQMRFHTLRGNIIWLDMRSTPRRLKDGRTVWDGVGIDITDIKQTEDALRQSEAHLAMAQKVAQIGSWEFDLQSQKINWSETTFRHWGVEPDQGEPSFAELLERVHPEDQEVLQQHLERAITQGIPYAFDLRIVCPDGSIRYLDSRAEPVVNAQGRVIKLIGTSLDITDRKQTEEALRESEERFRKAFDAAPIGMALVSPQGQFLKVNRSLCEIAGYSEAEILTLTFMDLTYADDLEASLEAMQRMLANEIRVYQAKKRYLHKQGDVIHILLNVSLVKDQHRQPLYFIAQIEDISDRYKVDRMKNEFISIVSHELRTPLTAIRGSLGILETGVFDQEPEQAKEMLQIAFNNSDRLVRLVNDILDLERLESGKTQLVMETCEIAHLVQQAIETVQAIANEAGVEICVMVPNMQIWAAPDAIVQTLLNLLSNAIKFSPVGGTVWLSTELVSKERQGGHGGQGRVGEWESGRVGESPPHPLTPSPPHPFTPSPLSPLSPQSPQSPLSPLSPQSPHLPISPSPNILFKVRDQGRGIPPEKLESIFGRFQQVDASDSRQKGGTGLGLSICKSIVEQHGGHIWVESVLGEGSTFYFTLPLRKGEA
jgi:PAS domain S-box-containing protein